ncbi:carboxypeptidase regulatory-like domain-containing protein [Granulicella sp. S190]|uniref:carboxypeptidase regulatory-like domain-containing protein n=1 Tax=Granulicella sp. S190 TaxID=1747226 RepID=UPI00131B37EB|nr:carboxypeptidase regulatory-like domain-containing protein [Granulicella sp. S190]
MESIRHSKIRILFLLPTMLVLLAGMALAQGNTGSIRGTIVDTTGSSIAGVEVVVTSEATGVSKTLTTSEAGFYSVDALTPGLYSVKAAHVGFTQLTVQHVQVDPGQTRETSVTLKVGSTGESVNVTADALAVETQDSGSGGTITSKQVENLMLNGRNFQSMGQLIPGVSSTAGNNQQTAGGLTGGTTLIVNGASVEYSVYTLDGVYNMNTGNLANINILPIVDSIDEFRILKDNYSARYGLAGSGQVVVETKSGTDTYHGSAWDYFRNDALDANPYFATVKTKLRQNIFGYSFGGPIRIPHIYGGNHKTFFFASNEWRRIETGSTAQGLVFTPAQRAGTLTNTTPLTIDALGQQQLAARGATNCITGPNTINPACIDPNAIALLNSLGELPNNPGSSLNYINQQSQTLSQDSYNYRVDHYITENEVLTGRVSYEQVKNGIPYNSFGGGIFATTPTTYYTTGINMMGRLTSTITSNLINTATVAETYDKPRINTSNFQLPSGVTINQAFPDANVLNKAPTVSFSGGYAGFGASTPPIHASDGEGILQDDLSWTKGSHVLQFGALYIAGIKNQNVFTLPGGSFAFNGTRTGDPVADYLLGLDSTYHQDSGQRSGSFHYRQGEAYAQDDWHVNRRLTVNAGLRWVYFSPNTNSGDQVSSFYASQYNASQAPVVTLGGGFLTNASGVPVTSTGSAANLTTGLVFAGQNGVPDGFFNATRKNFAPRIGFAYDLTGDGKTSLRAGYGIGYSRLAVEAIYNAFGQNPPFTQSSNINSGTLENPTAGLATGLTPQTIDAVGPKFTPTQLQSYSLTVERQLFPSAVLSVAYAGTQFRHEDTFGYDQNQPLPVTAPTQAGCLAAGQTSSTTYSFDPCINLGNSTSANFTRPYKGYSNIYTEAGIGSGNYNSLQTGFVYRKSNVNATVSYAYSKSLSQFGHSSNTGGGGSIAGGGGQGIQDWTNLAAEYGPSNFDRTHVLTFSGVYDIQAFRSSSNMLERQVLGGWSLATLSVLESGFAFTPGISTGVQGLATRPDQISPVRLLKNKSEWFDTTSFVAPENGFYGDARPGTIRGPREISFNIAGYKTFPIHERLNLQFRAEAFNFLNHPNFGNVDTNLGSGTYGRVTSSLDPRELEFSARVNF